ncbi:MAG: RagB/SusD family nutrient uptake outer membrane protein [Janthinobacterium lividum]
MKSLKSVYLLALAIGAGLALSSCEKVLDKSNLQSIDAGLIYSDSTLANLNLNYIYENNVPAWFGQSTIGIGSVNPGTLSEEYYAENNFLYGLLQPSDVTDFGTALAPANNYGRIRFVNAFLRDVKNGTLPGNTKARLRAQAQFWRAWRYFDLVRVYGGVPLVYVPLDAVGDDARAKTYLPRNTTTDCFKAIVADLDSAIATLPAKWTASGDWGRINKGSAAAFKARVLLTAASPQFNPSDDGAKWTSAYTASQQAQTLLTGAGYGLHASYDQLWFQEVNNPEAVLITGFNTATGDQVKKNNQYDNSTRPSYTGTGGGSNQPTWDIVQAYPMLDGKKPGASTKYTYTDQLFYKNRDPRFDKSVAYNGCTWPLNGNTSYKLWTYLTAPGKSVESKASNTGFYTRKAINSTAGISDAQYVGTDWIELRYAEVLMNLAESACGTNNLSVAMDQLKAIRKRAGIEAGTDGNYGLQAGMSRSQMFDAILYEREIEFAFEGKRFWDLRRWKKVESTLNGKRRRKLIVTLKSTAMGVPPDFATTRDNLNLDNVYTNYFTLDYTSSTAILDTKQAINWMDKYYFFAIPQPALDNNTSLIQNNTWGGSFDPLQ